jgi:hypothetical protein
MSWAYGDPAIREGLHNGLVKIDQEDLLASFDEWVKEDVQLNFQNADGEVITVQGAKRGNWPYARKKRRKLKDLNDGMDGMTWDYEIQVSRTQVHRWTHILFITLTFDPHKVTKEEAWHLLTSRGQALNRFSARLYKLFGSKATYKAKEAASSGYPAPHIVLIMDRPVLAFKHNLKWRMQRKGVVDDLKKAWPYGFVDVQACIGGKIKGRGVLSYVMKYATKTTDRTYDPKQLQIGKLTHAWNKLFGSRDVISKHFVQRLNMLHVEPTEESGPSGWELASIEVTPDMILVAQRTGWGIVRPRDELSFAG